MDTASTAREAADLLRYNVKHLYRLRYSDKANGQRVGHIRLIDPKR